MISVVIPTFQRPELLKRLLESIANQTKAPKDVIVVDDCSKNQHEYLAVIHSFEKRIPHLSFHSMEKNCGAPSCRNYGILKAQSDWVALVDDDDEWLPQKLQKQWEYIENFGHRNLDLLYTWTDVIYPSGEAQPLYRSTFSGLFHRAILHECFIPSPSVVVKKDRLIDAGLFDEAMPSCQDWDMWVRLAKLGGQCAVIDEACTLYHKHGGESIGLSPRAKLGYLFFYRKNLLDLLRYFEWRHLIRYMKLELKEFLK